MQIAHVADWGCHLWRPWSIAGQSRLQTWALKFGTGALVQMDVLFLCAAHAAASLWSSTCSCRLRLLSSFGVSLA